MPESQVLAGVALAMLAGVFNGLFALPLKLMPRWRWEHTWLVYAVVGMAIFPWVVAFFFTPHLGQLLGEAPLALICGFGFAWGVSSVAFGLALVRLGLGLGLALMMGLQAGLGSLVPMVILRPRALGTRSGHFVLAGNAILIVGICLSAYAGSLREKQHRGQQDHDHHRNQQRHAAFIFFQTSFFHFVRGAFCFSHPGRVPPAFGALFFPRCPPECSAPRRPRSVFQID